MHQDDQFSSHALTVTHQLLRKPIKQVKQFKIHHKDFINDEYIQSLIRCACFEFSLILDKQLFIQGMGTQILLWKVVWHFNNMAAIHNIVIANAILLFFLTYARTTFYRKISPDLPGASMLYSPPSLLSMWDLMVSTIDCQSSFQRGEHWSKNDWAWGSYSASSKISSIVSVFDGMSIPKEEFVLPLSSNMS